jgi:hypothetical protein
MVLRSRIHAFHSTRYLLRHSYLHYSTLHIHEVAHRLYPVFFLCLFFLLPLVLQRLFIVFIVRPCGLSAIV